MRLFFASDTTLTDESLTQIETNIGLKVSVNLAPRPYITTGSCFHSQPLNTQLIYSPPHYCEAHVLI